MGESDARILKMVIWKVVALLPLLASGEAQNALFSAITFKLITIQEVQCINDYL